MAKVSKKKPLGRGLSSLLGENLKVKSSQLDIQKIHYSWKDNNTKKYKK